VSAAATLLEVSSADLRRLVWATPALMDAVFEELERAIDRAVSVLLEGLQHENIARRLEAAKFFLRSQADVAGGEMAERSIRLAVRPSLVGAMLAKRMVGFSPCIRERTTS
jgi:hypothetical protein